MAILLSGLVRIYVVDDGFIAVRYATNLLNGKGLVFNPGERVEGVSDLLWTLLLAVPLSLGRRPETFAIVIGVLSGMFAFYLAYRVAVRTYGVSAWIALALTLACMFNVDFWTACTNGLESGLCSLLLMLSIYLWSESRFTMAGVALGVLVFVRPEALMLAPLAAIAIALSRDEPSQFSFLWPWAGLATTSFIFRLAYYHALLPNTVAAKSHPLNARSLILGLEYISRFSNGMALLICLVVIAFFTRYRSIAAIALMWMFALFFVVTMNGGDWMPGFRLLVVLLPLLTLAAILGFTSLVGGREGLRIPATAVLVGFLFLMHVSSIEPAMITDWSWSGSIFALTKRSGFPGSLPELTGENAYIRLAQALKPELDAGDIVSPEALGLFSSLLMPIRMHDFMGLTDRHVAVYGKDYDPPMGKNDFRYSVETIAPTLFIFHSGMEFPRKMQVRTGGAFSRAYALEKIPGFSLTGTEVPFVLAIRRDREERISNALKRENIPLETISDFDLSSKVMKTHDLF